ncbi:hypothetical protein J4214_03685 [Candidatus Woesearchaeota archaeon]|nr:hypothetical protein [Candidatus Woesearchaeota archaeon]
MQVIGFNIEKIEAEKTVQEVRDLKVKYNTNIKSVTLEEMNIGKKQEVLRVNFQFKVEYDPNIGNISFTGHVLILEDPKKAKVIIEQWNKNQDNTTPFSVQVINIILIRANIKALLIAQEVNLPPHIPMPRLAPNKNIRPDNYIG